MRTPEFFPAVDCYLGSKAKTKLYLNDKMIFQGIRNIGNTCYIASLIQALRATSITVTGLLGKLLDSGVTNETLKELQETGWNPHDASDVAELLQHVAYSSIKEEGKMKLATGSSVLTKQWHQNFEGKTKGIAKTLFGQFAVVCACSKCNHKVVSSEIFIDLPIATPITDLNCALEAMFATEVIDWTCENCKNNKNNTKTLRFERLPQVLMMRFLYRRMTTVPTQLDIGKYCTRKKHGSTYDLRALVCLLGDHYITICKNDNEWILCDDDTIRPITDVSGYLKQAYMLVYNIQK